MEREEQRTKDSLFKQVLGVNRPRLIRALSRANLYAWDQALCLIYYSLDELSGSDRRNADKTVQRLRLVGTIKREINRPEIKTYLLDALDQGLGIMDMLRHVEQLAADNVIGEMDAKLVQRVIEEEQIMFGKQYKPTYYSYYSMHSMLSAPLVVFQQLLKIHKPDEFVDGVTKDYLKNKWQKKSFRRNEWEGESLDIEQILLNIEQDKYRSDIDKATFGDELIRYLDKALGKQIQRAFSSLAATEASTDIAPVMDSLIKRRREKDDELTLNINRKALSRLCHLGQAPQVSELIARELMAEFDGSKQPRLAGMHDPEDKKAPSLKALARWYERCNALKLTREDQLPGHIAAVIYELLFDARFFEYVTNSPYELIGLEEKNRVEQLLKLTTEVIRKTLYYPGEPQFPSRDFPIRKENELAEYLEEKTAEYRLATPLMKDWIDYDKKKTTDRFKRPRKALRDSVNCAKKRIEAQREKGIKEAFPVGSYYPLPLWTDLLKAEPDQDNQKDSPDND